MMVTVKILLLAATLAIVQGLEKPTEDQLDVIKDHIKDIFNDDNELQGTALRLTFHDCLHNGCDGCINLDHEFNAGLDKIVNKYEDIIDHADIAPFLGRADLWSLGGIVAVEEGVRLSNEEKCPEDRKGGGGGRPSGGARCMPEPNIAFEWGRVDCATAPSTNEEGPEAEPDMNRDEMLAVFKDNFDFEPEQVAALMGAHALGRARLEISGYEGAFTENEENFFDNQYYKNMVGKGRVYKNEPNFPDEPEDKEFQFNIFKRQGKGGKGRKGHGGPGQDSPSERVGMFLNTDVELWWDIDFDGASGTDCKLNRRSPLYEPDEEREMSMFASERKRPGGRPGGSGGRPGGSGGRPGGGSGENICGQANSDTASKVREFAKSPDAFMTEFGAVFAEMMRKGQSNLETIP